jgi:hypothetical protein
MQMSSRFLALIALLAVVTVGCDNRSAQQQLGRKALDAIDYTQGNAEINNISDRQRIVASPHIVGYVAFLSYTGTLMLYSATRGKCTSSTKRLLAPTSDNAADDGTFGSSDSYIYCFTPTGKMIQWNGPYLYSNAPIRFDKAPTAKSP